MKQEEKIKKVAKSLLNKVDVLCKLDGSYDELEAQNKEERTKALEKAVMATHRWGVTGKVAGIVYDSIMKQLSKLSIKEFNQLASLIVRSSRDVEDKRRYAALSNLLPLLAHSVIDRVAETGQSYILEWLETTLLYEVKNIVEANQPKRVEEICGACLDFDSKETKEIKQTIYEGEAKYAMVLAQLDKVVDEDAKNI